MSLLAHRPVLAAGQGFWDLVVRTRLANYVDRTGVFVRSTLGYHRPGAEKLTFDLRLPPAEFLSSFARAMWDEEMDIVMDDLMEAYRQATLWPIAELACESLPEDEEGVKRLLADPFVTSPGAVCPTCLKEGHPSYRRAPWQVGVITACLDHKVLLVDRASCGSPVGGESLRGRLPLSSAHHPPTRACPGCRLDGIEAVSLEEDAAGLRAQGILQAKLGLRDPDGDIAEALKEGLLALPRHRFWKALSALLYLGAHLASISPEMLHDPLKRAPEIRGIHRPGVYPVVPDRYAMHCLVATVIGWMEHPESLGESVRAVVMPRYHYLGRLDLPDVLSLHFDSSPEATEAVREALKAISSGWISLEEIAEGRPDEGLTAARLEAEARRVGINPGSLEGIGANKKELYVSPEDAERLSRIVLLCMAPDCSGEVVGYKGDYRFCEKHEFRCRDRNCEKAAGRDGTCSAHRQNGASAVPSAAVSVFVETLSESDSAARVLSKKCAYPGGCLRASSTDYGYYCRIHAQELDVPRRRYLCQHLECSRPSHKSCRPFCWTHAPEHGIPTPERCRRTPCRGYAKPGTGGLCARCFADPTRAVTRSKQSGRSRCAIVVCTFPRASRYGKYCVVHGTESGTDKPSAWCEEEDCRRYRLGKAGYCYRHAREKRIWISGVMCAETTEECFCRATSYGGFCRKHGGDPWKPRRKAARR